jgi:hypothetical protein
MALLISKPASVTKGTPQVISFDRDEVAALISDEYFQDPLNWSKVTFYYKDATGIQKNYCHMDLVSDSGSFKVSVRALTNTWQLFKVFVEDFDGGLYVIRRADLGSSDDLVVSA